MGYHLLLIDFQLDAKQHGKNHMLESLGVVSLCRSQVLQDQH